MRGAGDKREVLVKLMSLTCTPNILCTGLGEHGHMVMTVAGDEGWADWCAVSFAGL